MDFESLSASLEPWPLAALGLCTQKDDASYGPSDGRSRANAKVRLFLYFLPY